MQILTTELQRKIQEDARKFRPLRSRSITRNTSDTFEQFNVDRLFVPRTKQPDAESREEEEKDEKLSDEAKKAKEAAEKAKADEAEQAMSKLAESLRARAAAGEDIVKLQKEAFEAAGMKIESPTVNLPNVRRTGLPPAHAAVFDLKPGEVSQVISDAGGHYIYKVNSKDHLTLDQATNEIHSKLQNDRTREMMEKVNNSFKVETNDAYFGPGGVGAAPPPRHAAIRCQCLRLSRVQAERHDSTCGSTASTTSALRNRTDGETCRCRDRCVGQSGFQATAAAGKLFGDWGGRQSTPHRLRVAV